MDYVVNKSKMEIMVRDADQERYERLLFGKSQ